MGLYKSLTNTNKVQSSLEIFDLGYNRAELLEQTAPLDGGREVIRSVDFMNRNWSGREDLNLRPPHPQCGALPGCATPRQC